MSHDTMIVTTETDASRQLSAAMLPLPLPTPTTPIRIRRATLDDIAFMDALQKKHSKALGFFSRAMFEGYITKYRTLIAEDSTTGRAVGYVASTDRYLKRDELGAVFQLCVDETYRRGFVAAALLKEVFEQSSYGCRLYCCWCAQDLPANRFWEAMGFVPIAYRAGSAKKSRIHIYWQKRIRAGDVTTPYWFPAKTEGGAIREDRIILPIPPGMRWHDALPVLVPGANEEVAAEQTKRLPGGGAKKTPAVKQAARPIMHTPNGIRMAAPAPTPEPAADKTAEKTKSKPTRKKQKHDPALIAKARELRDRWMEHVNVNGIERQVGGRQLLGLGKYDVARSWRRDVLRPEMTRLTDATSAMLGHTAISG